MGSACLCTISLASQQLCLTKSTASAWVTVWGTRRGSFEMVGSFLVLNVGIPLRQGTQILLCRFSILASQATLCFQGVRKRHYSYSSRWVYNNAASSTGSALYSSELSRLCAAG